MNKSWSVNRGWGFVSKGTEISLGKFVPEYFTPLTLDSQTGVVSTEDTVEIWEEAREEMVKKVREEAGGSKGADSPMTDKTEPEKSFWVSRSDGWVINREVKKIVLLEFKRTRDVGESYFMDMWKKAQDSIPLS